MRRVKMHKNYHRDCFKNYQCDEITFEKEAGKHDADDQCTYCLTLLQPTAVVKLIEKPKFYW